jgi:hypothetical protein
VKLENGMSKDPLRKPVALKESARPAFGYCIEIEKSEKLLGLSK